MRTMLVAIDFSDITPAVIQAASEWAKAGNYRVHLLHVLPEEADLVGYETGMQLLPRVPMAQSPEDARLMDSCREGLEADGIGVTSHIVEGVPALEIADEAEAVRADLIVMGSHRHGSLHHLLLGSVSGGVLKRVTCPVLLVPAPLTSTDSLAQASSSSTADASADSSQKGNGVGV